MYYTREQHKRFLDLELQAISEDYLKTIQKNALALVSENEIYVSRFVKINHVPDNGNQDNMPSGQMILKFSKRLGIPRKNEFFTAVILDTTMSLPKKWGNLSWVQLRKHQVKFSEAHCVWQGKDKGDDTLICGFSGISLDFAKYLTINKLENCAVILGPHEPPMNYYRNLIQVVSNTKEEPSTKEILDFDQKNTLWNPQNFTSDGSRIEYLLKELTKKDEFIFQGPPGTGKTYLMAELVSKLLEMGKSVLVTALTNRALIELAQKSFLDSFLKQGKVMKTNVSTDEYDLCKNLIPIDSKNISCEKGKLTLATFYNSSGWARDCYAEQPFDFVIMDEASQAVFAMIAACKCLGKKVIWIGDQNQMQPIIKLGQEQLVRNDFGMLADGFQTLCQNFDYQSFILTKTYRLLPKAAELTSVFYPVSLISTADFDYILNDCNNSFIPKNGGCKVVLRDMPNSARADFESCQFTIRIVSDLLNKHPRINIAVLTKFKATVRLLQKICIETIGHKNNILIDTVERIQGMTCDVCIYFIPNDLLSMSLDKSLFNVATSRAKQATIIVADKRIMGENMSEEVRKYLLKAQEDKYAEFEPKKISSGNVSISVVGKIDLPQPNKTKNSIPDDAVLVIDTNIFVNCPDIIGKVCNKYKIVIPAKVLEELDKLKLKPEIDKQKINSAARNIHEAFKKNFSKMEDADINLLPKSFDKKNPDCMILSVALKHKNKAVLLTSDNMLIARASGLNVNAISLNDV